LGARRCGRHEGLSVRGRPTAGRGLRRLESPVTEDPSRRFAAGYSSGAFMAHYLACWRGAMLRGVATIAGGYGPVPPTECTGDVAALLIQDEDDQTVEPWKTISARDDHVARNGCDPDVSTTPFDPAPCREYGGCESGYPVVWCQTAGQDHSAQPDLSARAFWHFLSTLP
jgi:polyhydroxybutyrate depolymerase